MFASLGKSIPMFNRNCLEGTNVPLKFPLSGASYSSPTIVLHFLGFVHSNGQGSSLSCFVVVVRVFVVDVVIDAIVVVVSKVVVVVAVVVVSVVVVAVVAVVVDRNLAVVSAVDVVVIGVVVLIVDVSEVVLA